MPSGVTLYPVELRARFHWLDIGTLPQPKPRGRRTLSPFSLDRTTSVWTSITESLKVDVQVTSWTREYLITSLPDRAIYRMKGRASPYWRKMPIIPVDQPAKRFRLMNKTRALNKKPGRRPASSDTGSRPKPRRRTQEERTATTRRKLIDAAIVCLSELGYLEATIEVVASRAGVSRGAVQHHFGSRNGLLIAVVDDFGLALSASDEISSDLTVAERVSGAIDRTWELVRSPHFIAVVQIWLATRNIPDVVHITSRKIALFEREMDRRWQKLFPETKMSPAKVALIRHIVLATLRGLALRALYRRGRASWSDDIEMLKSIVATALT